MIKRYISVLLSITVCIGLFTGCAKDDGNANKPDDSSSENAITAELKESLDFNGQDIYWVIPPGYGYFDLEGKDPYARRQNKRIEQLNKKYNVNIVRKEGKGLYWNTMVTSILAGEPEGHIMLTTASYALNWFKAGAFADLTDAMKKTGIDFSDERYDQSVFRHSCLNGQVFSFCNRSIDGPGSIWIYNKRIFNEMNLGDPYEMIKNKTWTWDKVEEIATKATKRKADGTVEQWGLAFSMHSGLWSMFMSTNGGGFASMSKDGPIITLNNAVGTTAMEKFYDWAVTKKIAYVNDGSRSWDAVFQDFTKGNIAMAQVHNKFFTVASEAQMQDDFGVILPPLGPNATDYYNPGSTGDYYFIPKTYENMADKLLLLMDEIWAPYDDASYDDLVAEKYASLVRDEASLDMLIDLVNGNQRDSEWDPYDIDFSGMLGVAWGDVSTDQMLSDVLDGVLKPTEAISKYSTLFQTALTDAWGDLEYTPIT